jgi:hypothetical protein
VASLQHNSEPSTALLLLLGSAAQATRLFIAIFVQEQLLVEPLLAILQLVCTQRQEQRLEAELALRAISVKSLRSLGRQLHLVEQRLVIQQ